MAPVIAVVVPCYNEEAVLPETVKRLSALLLRLSSAGTVDPKSRMILVDDGSRDQTWPIIEALAANRHDVEGIKFAHNAGHQNALWAGLMAARQTVDAAISIDADLQDDIEAIPKFIEAFGRGCDIVYGVRSARTADSRFKRVTARRFYALMRKMGADVVDDHAEYRLMSRRALDALSEFTETNLFLRGMVPLLGFTSESVEYERGERFAGETKYPFRKMLAFALQGITSFSVKPIHWVTLLGILFSLFGIGIALYVLLSIAFGFAAPGWSSLMISIWIIGGAQLIALGLIGEYIGRIYTEVKRRPKYIIESHIRKDGK